MPQHNPGRVRHRKPVESGGNKTAPGVASTNTEGLTRSSGTSREGMAVMIAASNSEREPFAAVFAARAKRIEQATRAHAVMLARTDEVGRPLYRLTSGGNVVRTRPITQRLKAKVLNRDGHACVECGAKADAYGVLHIAHIEDYRVNGNNDIDNLRTLCPPCHNAEEVPCAREV